MKKTHIARLVGVIGLVLIVIGLIKLVAIGYYPHELVPYLLLTLIGAGIAFAADRWYRRAKTEELDR